MRRYNVQPARPLTNQSGIKARISAEKMAKNVMRRELQMMSRAPTSLGAPVSIPGAVAYTYNALGSTDEGREFALINLHPCGEYLADCCGIPDESQVSSVTPAFRGDSVVAINANYFSTPPTLPADFRYDIQLCVLPFPEIEYIFRVRVPSLNTGWSKWVVRRTAYFSNSPDGSAVTLADAGYSTARMIGRGITVHFDAPELANQGRLIAGQIKPPNANNDYSPPNVTTTYNAPPVRLHTFYLPQSETELTVQDPLAAQWEAKLGSYIPHRFVQPSQFFSRARAGRPITVQTGSSDAPVESRIPATYLRFVGDPSYIDDYSAAQSEYVYHEQAPTWQPAAGTPGDIPLPYECDWGVSDVLNQYTSVQFYLGIQNTAQLHVKTRLYLENEVHAYDSPVTPFLHKSPQFDPQAMYIVAIISQAQQHVFFASDNDLSSILQSIGKILPGLLNAAGNSGLPIISTVGKAGGVLGGHLKDLLSGF